MRVLDKPGLMRGEAILSSVFSTDETPWHFELADIVGSVAAYIGHGHDTHELFKVMRPRVGVGIARDMEKVFHMFDDMDGRGLWSQGPAIEDIQFSHPKLRSYYPQVERRREAILNQVRNHSFGASNPY